MLNPADADFAERLSARLAPGAVRAAEARHLTEPRGRFRAAAGMLALPRSTEEVAAIVALCAERRVGIVPWGGGTGLVAGQVKSEGPAPLIVSLERMTTLRGVWPDENVMIVDAGVVLADARRHAERSGRQFPLSIASEGSARIGGILATNAGGVNVLRYGNARDLCLGIEAVLPDGSILHGLKRLRKDNSGYDLRHLLVGSEGSLGIITAAALRLYPIPPGRGTAMFQVAGTEAALKLLALVDRRTGGGTSAFELIHRQGLLFLDEVLPDLRQPFPIRPEWLVLVEIGLPNGLDPAAVLADVYAEAAAAGLVSDGVIAASDAQRAQFWALREGLPEANRRIGAISSHDISLPLSSIAEFLRRSGPALQGIGDLRINCFGHLGDGNLHYNVFPQRGRKREDYEGARSAIKTCVHDLVHELGGSISAEHGIGRLKVEDLETYGDPAKLAAMRVIKAALDPLGIMNPGAVLRESQSAEPGRLPG